MQQETIKSVNINGENITLKNSLRARIIFEAITDKPCNIKTETDIYVYLYSVIMASAQAQGTELTLDFDTFIDWLDEDSTRLTALIDWLMVSQRIADHLAGTDRDTSETESDSKKK